MHKSSFTILVVLVLSMFSATSISALEVVVDEAGTVLMYQDGVLGDSTESNKPLKPAPSTNISAEQKKLLRVRNSGDQHSIEVIDKQRDKNQETKAIKAERLRLQMDAKPNFKVATPSSDQRELLHHVEGKEAQKSLEERKERTDEKIELRRSTAASTSALELRSRATRATIPVPREVVIDPETSEVGIVLPNGEIKAVNHLPDQAQAKIDALVSSAEDLELTTLDDGTVVYKTTVSKVFRMLGVIPRRVTTDVILDDQTGEVRQEKHAHNPIDRVLNMLSF